MQEPTDDQLDGFFRKSAEEFDTPFDPAPWQVLKNRLDNHDRLTIWEHLLRWGLPVLLLLLLTGGSWNAHQQRSREVRPLSNETVAGLPGKTIPGLPNKTLSGLVESDSPAPTTDTRARQDNDGRPTESAGADRPNPAASATASGPAATAKRAEAIRPTTGSAVTVSTASTGNRKRIGLNTRGLKRSHQLPGRRMTNGSSSIFSTTNYATTPAPSFTERRMTPDAPGELPAKDSPPSVDLPIQTNATAEPALRTSFAELVNRPGQWPKPVSFAGRAVAMPTDSVAAKQPVSVPPVPVQRGLSVRFVVSPDLSAIGLRNFQRPGTNVGLLLEYRLASRWSVQAGVIQSTKVYKASTSRYALPAYVSYWKVRPESMSGRCNMLDIPLNLRYDVAIRPRLTGQLPSRWFVSGGVTTYIMRQEDYVYNYAETDKPHVYANMKGWSGETGAYGLSQLNLSAGYERALSKRLAWQVEPFVKVPLRGVGFYKINLLSTGAFFSLRYKL